MCNHVTLPVRLQPSLPLSQLSTQPSVHAISTSQTPVDRNRAVRPNLFWCRCRIMTSHMGYEGTKKSRLGEWFALKSRNLIGAHPISHDATPRRPRRRSRPPPHVPAASRDAAMPTTWGRTPKSVFAENHTTTTLAPWRIFLLTVTNEGTK